MKIFVNDKKSEGFYFFEVQTEIGIFGYTFIESYFGYLLMYM